MTKVWSGIVADVERALRPCKSELLARSRANRGMHTLMQMYEDAASEVRKEILVLCTRANNKKQKHKKERELQLKKK